MEQKNVGLSYLLLGLSVFGLAGIHRFYLGKPVSGVMWLCTWGFFGIGTFIDLFLIPQMVENENIRRGMKALQPGYAAPRLASGPTPPQASPEQRVLKAAKKHGGKVTVALLSVETGMPLRQARSLLQTMAKDGFVRRDVNMDGADLFVFPGLTTNEPFDLDKL